VQGWGWTGGSVLPRRRHGALSPGTRRSAHLDDGRYAGSAGSISPTPESGEDDSEPVGLPNLSPVISMLFYMGKVAFIATAGIALMALIITYLRKFLE
jgi:hypothetical protein